MDATPELKPETDRDALPTETPSGRLRAARVVWEPIEEDESGDDMPRDVLPMDPKIAELAQSIFEEEFFAEFGSADIGDTWVS